MSNKTDIYSINKIKDKTIFLNVFKLNHLKIELDILLNHEIHYLTICTISFQLKH